MSEAIEAYYHTWESELTLLRTDDLLVNIDPKKVLSDREMLWEQTPTSNHIIKEFKKLKREQGIDALTFAQGTLHWQKGNKTLQTPVFLFELTKIQLDQKAIEFADQAQLNPFIKLLLKNEWQLDAPDQPDNDWILKLVERGIFTAYTDESFIGNFHPQRYELRREWEALRVQNEFSPALLQVLGDFDREIQSDKTVPIKGQITTLDPDQKKAIELAASNSCVIYGPPGTGKSAVLSNFIAQVIFEQKKALVVSEKRGALEVLKHRLTEAGLGDYCLIAPNKNELASFFQQLQTDFHKLLNARLTAPPPTFEKSNKAAQYWRERKQLEQEAQLSLEELLDSFGPKINRPKATISDRWLHWLHARKHQSKIPNDLLKIAAQLSKNWAQQPLEILEKDWREWQSLFGNLQHKFNIEKSGALEELSKKCLVCHQFQTQVFQKYASLLDHDQDKLSKVLNSYLNTEKQRIHLEDQLSAWLQIPSLEEWRVLKSLAAEKGFFNKRKWRSVSKIWLRLAQTPIEQFEKPLAKYWQVKAQLHQAELKLAQYGIEISEQEVKIVLQFIKQVNWEQYQWYRKLPIEERDNYLKFQPQIYRFNSLHRALFQANELPLIALELALTSNWESFTNHFPALQKIPHDLWESFGQDDPNDKRLKEEFWAYVRVHYPLLYQWGNEAFITALDVAISEEKDKLKQFAQSAKNKQIEHFTALEALLNMPLRKLTEAQKNERQSLRKGKSLLIKEMAKTRQFIPLKNLLEGSAAPWLYAIYPIWLLNPTQVANCLPMELAMFDYGLFDEASQLPLSHAIGSLQRVKTAMIAGDPEQMRPSSYFSTQPEGVIDLLHQAAFHLPRHLLSYHYRSEHPSLIAFSNKHFYKNELKTWPSLDMNKQAIFQHYVPNGIYQERQNKTEAKALAQALKLHLQQQEKVGVVAFSKQQLQCIYDCLSVQDQALLDEKINHRQAFFLALEQIQGEECDHLLISFGFGKNQEGEFNLRFGPMNQQQGSKRLNVLLTRAKKTLHFYCAVKATDFPSKRSESVELIYQWFSFLENPTEQTSTYEASERLASANDFDSYLHSYEVLKQRSVLPDRV